MIGLNKIRSHFLTGHQRTIRAYKNVGYSFIFKVISVASQFALIPLTLKYLDSYRYGLWLTIASVFNWFTLFDLGIGNGLKNKISESIAKHQLNLAKIYISTAYALISIIFIGVLIIFWTANPFINWNDFLNAPNYFDENLNDVILLVGTLFSIQFILSLIGSVLAANQNYRLYGLINPIINLLSLIFVFLLLQLTHTSFFLLAFVFSAVPVLVYFVFTISVFQGKCKNISPAISYVRMGMYKELLTLGAKFLIIQVASLLLFTTSNILIANFFDTSQVTNYNISFRYFSIVTLINGIIINPFWPAITEAYTKDDLPWISQTMKKLKYISWSLSCLTVLMVFFANVVYSLWIGADYQISNALNFTNAIYMIVILLANPYVIFLNAVSKIKIQLISCLVSLVITIPLAYLFSITFKLHISGIVLATIASTLPTMIVVKIQYYKIMSGTAKGIWNE